MAPPYLGRDLRWTDEAEALQRLGLRSGSRQRLIMPRTRLRTIGIWRPFIPFIPRDPGTSTEQPSSWCHFSAFIVKKHS